MNKQKILIVDDSEMNRMLLMAILGDEYDFIEAENGRKAVYLLHQDVNIDLMLLDITMPEMNGFEVLEKMNQFHWIDEIPVIMISADESMHAVEKSYDLGVTDYIHRPFDAFIVRRRVQNTLNLYANQKRLMDMVADQIYKNEKDNNLMIGILSHIVEFRNSESAQHVVHIRTVTELLLRQLAKKTDSYDLSEEKIRMITTASALHDIGKINIPEKILNKPGPLTSEEFAVMKTHTTIGASMLEGLFPKRQEPLLQVALEICRWHHERWDGCGYPDGLLGEQIPISAQVVALADVYDALTSDRCYKKAYDHDTAITMILNGECGAFNPILLDCLRDIGSHLRTVMQETTIDTSLYRDTQRLSFEILQKNAMPRNDRAQRLLEIAEKKKDFFASCCGGLQFEYDTLSGIATVTDWDKPPRYRKTLRDCSAPKNFRRLNPVEFDRLTQALDATTPENNEFSMSMQLPTAEGLCWHDIRVQTLWSPLQPDHYVSAIGYLVNSHKQLAVSDPLRSDAAPTAHAMRHLRRIFNIVRLIDPTNSTLLELDDNGVLHRTNEHCAAYWDCDGTCSNCVATQAFAEKNILSKLEFTKSDIYYVIAKYICINGTPCVLEMISKTHEGRWIDANGTRFLLDRSRGETRELLMDPLTQVYSRRYFETYLAHLEGMDGLMVIDVDNFKYINDTYGHPTGDIALRDIAVTIQACVRSTDILIRYGGDEFLLFFPKMTDEILSAKKKQIQEAVRKIQMPEYPEITLSVSIGGVCGVHPISEAIRQADQLMYVNKKHKPRFTVQKPE